MKKYLMMGAAALMIGASFTSCSNDKDLYDPAANAQKFLQDYQAAFISVFGQPAANQTWGFGEPAGARFTRAITVNGDTYNKFPSADEIEAFFPTAIPAKTDEVSELEAKYKGTTVQTQYGETTLYDIYAIYQHKIVEGYNLKITGDGSYTNNVVELGGNYQNASWDNTVGKNVAHPYNVYVDVDGDVTIRRVGATHFNLYILKGNVTLESDYGEQAGVISVAAGATLIDQRNSIAANQGVKIFNRGTFNATNPDKYDIGNFCTFYNEGKFTASGPLTYSPGDANDSYFMNLGDEAEISAPAMTLNSTGNFFNSGKVNIANETKVTQARLYWVNDGFYKTGTMTFSAKNTTFYNYCQLIVEGKAHMYDGEFNLMTNSYTEAGTAEFDNFFINMYGSTGVYVKGNVALEAQGDGTFQGFKNKDNSGNKYLLVGGKMTIISHKQTLSIESGITYSINAMEINKKGAVVTEEYLQSIGDGDYPVTVLEGTECPYGQLTVTPNTNSCGATWSTGGGEEKPIVKEIRIMAEDVAASAGSDIDFNDVVFDVKAEFPVGVETVNTVTITLHAAGGTMPLYIGDVEVHNKLGITDVRTMINTNAEAYADGVNYFAQDGVAPQTFELAATVSKDNFLTDVNNNVVITVNNNDNVVPVLAQQGEPSAKIAVPVGTPWAKEKVNMGDAFSQFRDWVNTTIPEKWYNSWVDGMVIK